MKMRLRRLIGLLLLSFLLAAGCAFADVVTYGDVTYVFAAQPEGAAALTLTLQGVYSDPRTMQERTLPALAGAVFGVYTRGAGGELVPYPDPADPSQPLTLTTGETAVSVNLPRSLELYLCQLSAPEGYLPALTEPLAIEPPCEIVLEAKALGKTGVRVQLLGDTDEGPKPLPGVRFRLEGEETAMEAVTDEEGIALLTEVPAGEYTLCQLSAPEPYTIDEQTLAVTVREGEITPLEIINSLPGRLTLRVSGMSADALTGQVRLLPLARAYEVQTQAGEVVGTLAAGESLELPASQGGTEYLLVPLQAQADGYTAGEPGEALVFSGTQTIYQAVVKSEGGFFSFAHVAAEDGTPVAGGTFALYGADGEEVLRFEADSEGCFASVNPLPPGEYTLRMLYAPQGRIYTDAGVTVQISSYLAKSDAAQVVFASEAVPQALLTPQVTCDATTYESLFTAPAAGTFTLRAWEEEPVLAVTDPVFAVDWPQIAGLVVEDVAEDGSGAFTLAQRFALEGAEEVRSLSLSGTVSYQITYPADAQGGMRTLEVCEPFRVTVARFKQAQPVHYALWGRLTDAEGRALSGRQVSLLDADGSLLKQVLTDPLGNYAFEDAPQGSSVSVTADEGYGIAWTEDGAQMLPLTTVRARVIGGESVQGATVKISFGSLGEQEAGPGEEAVFTGLPQEEDALAVEAPQGIVYRIVPQEQGACIELYQGASLFGCARDPEGNALAGVTVRLDDETVATDADGAYAFGGLLPGAHTLSFAFADGYVACGEETVALQIEEGERCQWDAVGMMPACVEGVLTEEGTPLAGVRVTLGEMRAQTDGEGRFAFEGLTLGRYTLSAALPEGMAALDTPQEILIEASGQRVDVSLQAVRAASVSGTVWDDEDNNGLLSAQEEGVSGAQITLCTASGETIATVTTEEDGAFTFTGLAPGEYSIAVCLPEGMIFAREAEGMERLIAGLDEREGASEPFHLASGEERSGLLCGAVVSGTVSGYVWEDVNGDGRRDEDEPPLAGVTVSLVAEDGTQNDIRTDAQGGYSFENLRSGDYTLSITLPEGMLFTAGEDSGFDAIDGAQAETDVSIRLWRREAAVNAGGVRQAEVTALVFRDETADGSRQAAEPGMQDVQVTLLREDGSRLTEAASAVTDETGAVCFDGVRPGNYLLEIKTPAENWAFTTQETERTQALAVQSGATVDAGVIGLTELGTISGTVFADTDYDGLRAQDDPGVAATVWLLDATGEAVAQVQTDANGGYAFEGLKAGRYTVRFQLPEGWQFTRARDDAGSFNSDVPETADRVASTAQMYLPMGETLLADAGGYAPASLSGAVWLDEADSGVYAGAQAGLAGVTVTLARDGETVAVAATQEDGTYGFDALPPGTYTLRAALPEGLLPADDALEQQWTLAMGEECNNVRIALVQAACVSGTADGLSGMTLVLSGEGGEHTAVTDEQGRFRLEDVRPGTYTVAAALPEGWALASLDDALQEITLLPAEEKTMVYRVLPEAVISGLVYLDEDGDGVNADETPLAGAQGVLSLLQDETEKTVCTFVTAEDGSFRVDALPPGEYRLVFASAQEGVYFDAVEPITLSQAQTWQNDIAAWHAVTLTGFVWDDADADGLCGRGEQRLAGIEVALLDEKGGVLQQALTDEQGAYAFTGVRPGTAYVRFTLAEDCVFSDYTLGGSQVVVQRENKGIAGPYALKGGESRISILAGSMQAGVVGDLVWLDENGNGLQDSGEPGLAGIRVMLLSVEEDYTQTQIFQTRTDANGRYRFRSVRPGRYRVAFSLDGYEPTVTMDDFPQINSKIITSRDGIYLTEAFLLRSGESRLGEDAGFVVEQQER